MKKLLALLGSMFVSISLGWAQGVTIGLSLDQEHFLAGETLIVKLRVTNFSGQSLELGHDDQWVTFAVEDSRQFSIQRRGQVPVKGVFTLQPSEAGTKRVDLAPYFELNKVGRYFVTARVHFPQWDHTIQSKPVSFDIIGGNKIWEQDFGLPQLSQDSTESPELRKYALIQTTHTKVIRLYFRLTDAREERVYRTFPLGNLVSFSNPVARLDRFSNLHVLYQSAGRIFAYCLVTPDGLLMSREAYEPTNTRPVLRAGEDGRIFVAGGARRIMASDLPPPFTLTQPPDATSIQP
jgi:hypothetical protein